jgi:hypothetical protein
LVTVFIGLAFRYELKELTVLNTAVKRLLANVSGGEVTGGANKSLSVQNRRAVVLSIHEHCAVF